MIFINILSTYKIVILLTYIKDKYLRMGYFLNKENTPTLTLPHRGGGMGGGQGGKTWRRERL